MKIRTSDGVEIDNFEKIRTVRDAVFGSFLTPKTPVVSPDTEKHSLRGHSIGLPVNLSLDMLRAADQIQLDIWKGKAYAGGNQVSCSVKQDMETLLNGLCSVCDDKNSVCSINCSISKIGEIFHLISSVMRHMGIRSETLGMDAMEELMTQTDQAEGRQCAAKK